jgi:hypothetical protein
MLFRRRGNGSLGGITVSFTFAVFLVCELHGNFFVH